MATQQQAAIVASTPGESTGDPRADNEHMLRQFELHSDQMLPCEVVSYERTGNGPSGNTATVRPLIAWLDVRDNKIPRHPLVRINVLSLGGGGFHVNFPLRKGDLGWIVASDRDLTTFKQLLAETTAASGRLHRFEDGLFVPDVFRKYQIHSEDADSMVIQSVDSSTRIAIRNGKIKITAPDEVRIDVPNTVITGDVTINKNLTVNQSTTINENLKVDKATTVTGMTTVNGGFAAVGAGGGASPVCQLPETTTIRNGASGAGIVVLTHGHIETAEADQRTKNGMVS